MINLRKIRNLFLLLTLVVVLVVAVVLSRARLFQVSSCCSEGRACEGLDSAAAEVAFSAPLLASGLIAVLKADEIQQRLGLGLSVLNLRTVHTAQQKRVWRYAPKTSPPGFLA